MGSEHSCPVVWTFFSTTLLWNWDEGWLFQSCGHCWVFQICWHTDCSMLTASSFRILNSLAGIPSPLLALLVVILPKAHSTSHFRISGYRWVAIPLWLSESLRFFFVCFVLFLYDSSVYSCHFFLISSFSVRSLLFLCFIVPILAWNIPLIAPVFLKSSLVFPILLFSSISFHCSLKKPLLSLLALLWNSAFSWIYLSLCPLPFASLLSLAICKGSSDNHFAFLHFFFFGMILVAASPV